MRKNFVWLACIVLFSIIEKQALAQSAPGNDSTHSFSYIIPAKPLIVHPLFTKQETPVMMPFSFPASFINPGFFCKQEVKMDKRLPIPLRVRLGSMQYCNWLEQKPGSIYPQ